MDKILTVCQAHDNLKAAIYDYIAALVVHESKSSVIRNITTCLCDAFISETLMLGAAHTYDRRREEQEETGELA
jgi:hypothetical protein